MKSRERVIQSLNHQEPDRVPIDLGATIVSSIVKKTYIELKQYLGMPIEEIKMLDYVQQLPYVDDGLMERFGVDFRTGAITSCDDAGGGYFRRGRLLCLHRSLGLEIAYAQKRWIVF